MDNILRTVLITIGMVSLILAVGFCSQLPWVVWLWPWVDTFSPYLFLGSIAAATTASLLWIGLCGELRTVAGGALHLTVFNTGLASSLFLLFQQGGDHNLLTGAYVCIAGALVSLTMFLWFRRYPLQNSRPMPLLVRISFGVFVVVLVLVGAGILLQIPNVFAWKLKPTTSALLGWFFLGAACYFLYGLVHPSWQKACGQLWAFLAYDLVLIVPYLLHFAVARPAQLPSLLINTLVLLYSGALAIYYLLVKKETRTWRKSSQTPAASELSVGDDFWPDAPAHPIEDDYYSELQNNEGSSATISSYLAGEGKSA